MLWCHNGSRQRKQARGVAIVLDTPLPQPLRVGKITEGNTVDQRKILVKLVSYSQKEFLLRDYSHIFFSNYEDKNENEIEKCTYIFVKNAKCK